MSPSAAHLLGFDPAQTTEVDLRHLVHPDDQAAYDRLVQGAVLQGGLPVEVRIGANDGTWRWFDVVAGKLTAIPDVGSVVVTARDISERKDADARLAGSERRFRSLVQNSSDIISTIDDSGKVVWVSESIRGVLGLAPAEMVDGPCSRLSRRAPVRVIRRVGTARSAEHQRNARRRENPRRRW